MKTIRIKSKHGAYSVLVGRNLLTKTGALLTKAGLKGKVLIVTQRRIDRYYGKVIRVSLKRQGFTVATHFVPQGEVAKSEKELFRLYRRLLKDGFERRDTVLALGGGVIGDLTGYAAASYLRGIAFVNVATTLLAQVDSAIGGKTAINLDEGKNLVGAFYPARVVISDVTTLKTLPNRELRASLAEVIKYGVIRDAKILTLLEKSVKQILGKNATLLEKLVLASTQIKAGVVSRDEFETKKERMILNFGHTIGHGLEQASKYRQLLHGEAVAIGMVAAARIANLMGFFSSAQLIRLIKIIQSYHLPTSIVGLQLKTNRVLLAMMRDKKKKSGCLRFILPSRVGQVFVSDQVDRRLIREVLLEIGGRP